MSTSLRTSQFASTKWFSALSESWWPAKGLHDRSAVLALILLERTAE
jgi:hypothetical protein